MHRSSILPRDGSMVCESLPGDEEYETYIDDTEYEKFPEY